MKNDKTIIKSNKKVKRTKQEKLKMASIITGGLAILFMCGFVVSSDINSDNINNLDKYEQVICKSDDYVNYSIDLKSQAWESYKNGKISLNEFKSIYNKDIDDVTRDDVRKFLPQENVHAYEELLQQVYKSRVAVAATGAGMGLDALATVLFAGLSFIETHYSNDDNQEEPVMDI